MCEEGFVDAGLRFAFEGDGADGSGSVLVVERNELTGGAFLDGHLGNNGDAKTGRNHAEDAAELAALEHDLGVPRESGRFAAPVGDLRRNHGGREKENNDDGRGPSGGRQPEFAYGGPPRAGGI